MKKAIALIPVATVVMCFLFSLIFGCISVSGFILVLTKSSISAFCVSIFSFLMGAGCIWTAGNIEIEIEWFDENKFFDDKNFND